jgi:hypothetical protein
MSHKMRGFVDQGAVAVVQKVGMARDDVGKGGRGHVLEVRDIDVGPRIQRRDHGLAIGWGANLDPPVHQGLGHRFGLPDATTDIERLVTVVRQPPFVILTLTATTGDHQGMEAQPETRLQFTKKCKRLGCQHLCHTGHLAQDGRTGRMSGAIEWHEIPSNSDAMSH